MVHVHVHACQGNRDGVVPALNSVVVLQLLHMKFNCSRVSNLRGNHAIACSGKPNSSSLSLSLSLPPFLQSQEKEKMLESNMSQLQLTVDWMLNEARERQKTYSSEKKQLIDDKVLYWSSDEDGMSENYKLKDPSKFLRELA